MTRAKPSLQPHLLTKSDLERLQVPPDAVSAWIASGSLEAVGELPDDSAAGTDPVFAVTTNALRQDLALRLLDIDKPVVVMTPLRVRSLLQRFADPANPRGGAAHEEALAAVVAEVQADVGELMQYAAHEAPGVAVEEEEEQEQREHVDAGGATDAAVEAAEEEDDDGSCFDAGDLERALDALDPPSEPSSEDAMPAPDPAATATPTTSESDPTMATESATAVLPAAPARATPPTLVPLPDASDVVLAAMITRVDSFLERLQESLLQLAQRPAPVAPAVPAPVPTDVTPIVQAVQTGFERAAQSAAATHGAIAALGERVGGLGAQFATGVDKLLRTALAPERAANPPAPPPPPPSPAPPIAPTITLPRQDRMPAALLALATSVLTWSLLFWWKTESQQLALGTLVGANLIGCCLLAARRARA